MPDDDRPSQEESGGRLQEALTARRDKLERLRTAGVEPFALGFDPNISAAVSARPRRVTAALPTT